MDFGVDRAMDVDATEEAGEEVPECRVMLSVRGLLSFVNLLYIYHTFSTQIDVQIATHHLLDHIEWDLLSPLTPEVFFQKLCTELSLSGEAIPLIAHAIHEELIKHKKDAIEWGVLGFDHEIPAEEPAMLDKPRDKSGLGLLKDKTGLGPCAKEWEGPEIAEERLEGLGRCRGI